MSAQPPFNTPNTEQVATEQPPKGGLDTKTWIIIVLILLLGAGGSAVGVWFYLSGNTPKTEKPVTQEQSEPDEANEEHSEDSEEKESDEESTPPVFVPLDPFTVNLQPDGQFLQATFSLQLKDEKEAERLKTFMPQLRSRLLLMLSGKTAEALSTQSGKSELIKEIKQLVSQPIKSGQKPIQIEDVHVTAFIIQ